MVCPVEDENRAKTFLRVPGKITGKKSSERLTQARVNALCMWPGGAGYTVRDTGVRGLELYKGKRKTSFVVYEERRVQSERIYSSKVIGDARTMSLVDARKLAKQLLGRNRLGKGKRRELKFSEALADYMIHLRDRAASRGKPDAWARRVDGLARLHLLPKWSKWSVAAMCEAPRAVREWHQTLSKTAPTSANHCARLIRATVRHARKLHRDLPPYDPTSAVRWNIERPRQVGMKPVHWPKWFSEWQAIPSPTRRAFHMLGLLTGLRPGELSRLRWRNVNLRMRTLSIENTKSKITATLPLSWPIAQALKLARPSTSEWVFPARGRSGHLMQFAEPTLPAFGHALRHVYADVAIDRGVSELERRLLMAHSLRGVSQEYVTIELIGSGGSLRRRQAAISREIVNRLGATPLALAGRAR